MNQTRSAQLIQSTLLVASVLFLGLVIANIWLYFNINFVPFSFSPTTGIVNQALPSSVIQVGDRVISINGMSIDESNFPKADIYQQQTPPTILIEYERAGIRQQSSVAMISQLLPMHYVEAVGVWICALMLWAGGTWVAATYRGTDWRLAIIFFLMMQSLAQLMAVGNNPVDTVTSSIGVLARNYAPFFTFYFHTLFPYRFGRRKLLNTISLLLFVACSLIAWTGISYLFFILAGNTSQLPTFANVTMILFPLSYGVSWLGSIMLLVVAFFKTTSQMQRKQIGIIVYSGIIALAPAVTLSILPWVLTSDILIDFVWTLPFIALIPVGYVYAIDRYQFIRVERTVSRVTNILLTLLVLSVVYAFGLNVIQSLVQPTTFDEAAVQIALLLLIAVSFEPLRRLVQRLIDNLLYGGWYDYRSVISTVADSLQSAENSPQHLAQSLTNTLQQSMNVRWAGILLRSNDQFVPAALTGDSEVTAWFETLTFDVAHPLIHPLQRNCQPLPTADWSSITKQTFSADAGETFWQNDYTQLIIPMCADTLIGMLILGLKYGGAPFSADDLRILEAVSQQTAFAINNVELAEQLSQKAYESEQFQRQAILAGEQERKRIARDIHDDVVQALVGFKYQLAEIESELDSAETPLHTQTTQLQTQSSDLIKTSRIILQDLRPATIALGIVPTLRSLLDRFEQETGIMVALKQTGTLTAAPSEEIMLCLVRCTQEILANIDQHAAATAAECALTLGDHSISLSISDNGAGMVIPDPLGTLMDNGHYGLVGIRQRVHLLNGHVNFTSAPEQGTTVQVTLATA